LGNRVSSDANAHTTVQVLLDPVNTAKLPIAVDFASGIGRYLLPSEKDRKVAVASNFVGDPFGKVVASRAPAW
jgi:hypothetical protein